MRRQSLVLISFLVASLAGCVGGPQAEEGPAVDIDPRPTLPPMIGETMSGRGTADPSGAWHFVGPVEGVVFFMQAVEMVPGEPLSFKVYLEFVPGGAVPQDAYLFYREPQVTIAAPGRFISIGGMSAHSEGAIGPVAWGSSSRADADVGYAVFLLYTPVPGHLNLTMVFDDTELRPWQPLVHEVPPVEQTVLTLPPGEEVTRTFALDRSHLVYARLEGSRPVAEESYRIRMDQDPYEKFDHRGTQDPEDPIPYTLWADGAGYAVTLPRPLNLLAQYDGPAEDQRLNIVFVGHDLSAVIEDAYGMKGQGSLEHFREF